MKTTPFPHFTGSSSGDSLKDPRRNVVRQGKGKAWNTQWKDKSGDGRKVVEESDVLKECVESQGIHGRKGVLPWGWGGGGAKEVTTSLI